MRKFNKKKVRRRGAILVTVVFVLAFATIFIAAAMTLTQATRKRIYNEAESDQARLTVTSVAEAFYHAVNMCEFDDETLVAMCDADTTVNVYASASADTVPGLQNEGDTDTAPVSYTSVRFYRKENVVGATKDEEFTYYADFSTHIYNNVQSVRATLTYTPQPKNKGSAPFDTQIDLNTKFGQNNLSEVGKGGDDDNNAFLVRKGGLNVDSTFSTNAVMVYCDGQVGFKDENFLCEDLVFLTGAVLHNYGTGVQTNFKGNVKNLFFFGDNNEQIADSKKGNWSKTGLNFYLCNRSNSSENSKDWTSGNNVYTITAAGEVTSTDKPTMTEAEKTAFKKKVQRYAAYNEKYKAGGSQAFPTTDSFLESAKNLKIDKTHSGSKNDSTLTKREKTLKELCDEYSWQKSGAVVPGGQYFISKDGGLDDKENNRFSSTSKICEPYIFVLDHTQTYRFYFGANQEFNLNYVTFIVDQPTPGNPVLFILEDGAKINWPGAGSPTKSNGYVGSNGIFAVQTRNKTPEQAYNYILNLVGNASQDTKAFASSEGKYDGKNEPCAMILGMGHNQLLIDKAVVIEAFIGMFNEKYETDKQSLVGFRNGDNAVFYGRLMTDGLGFVGVGGAVDSGNIFNPASPGTSTLIGSDPTLKKLITGFKLTSMIYYYDLPTV